MRPTQILAWKKPTEEPFPFKSMLPLKLRPRVSGKGDKAAEVSCLYEMSLVFACFKDNDFNQLLCSEQIKAFQKCYRNHMQESYQRKQRELKGIITPGEKNLTHKQINAMLQRFPNHQ